MLTEQERIDYCVYPGLYATEYMTLLYGRLNITLTQAQQDRLNLIYDCCNGWWREEIGYIARLLNRISHTDPSYPCLDGLLFTAVWVIFGQPDLDDQVPWGDNNTYMDIYNSLGSNQYALEDVRYIIKQMILQYGTG